MKRFLAIMALLISLTATVTAQQAVVTATVPDETVSVGKPFSLDLMMKAPYGSVVEWNPFATDTLSAQIDILKRGELQRTADADSNIIVQQQLTLMTFDTGYVTIPGLSLSTLQSPLSTLTDPITLYVNHTAVDTTQAYRPLMPPIDQPVRMKEVFPWILGVLLVVLLGFVVWFLLKRRKPRVDENGEPVKGPVIPPYDKAIGDLESLRQQKLCQIGKVKEYYSGLTDIAREYIEGQFGVNAVEMTTEEILTEVQELNFDAAIYHHLEDTMQLADLVKFAKYTTSSLDDDNAMTHMTDFVHQSYEHYKAAQAKEEEEARNHA